MTGLAAGVVGIATCAGWNVNERGDVAVLVLERKVPADVPILRVRLDSPPHELEDCRAAYRHVRAHASDLGIDPDRIAALGVSAGAHLATMLEQRDDPDRDTALAHDGRWEGRGND